MLSLWKYLIFLLIRCNGLVSKNCDFNSMCTCSSDQEEDSNDSRIHSISCISIPFYKFPNVPGKSINQIEVIGSKLTALDSESLVGCQVQSLILANSRLQYIADRTFSSMSKSLTSLDLSYNQLDSVPFSALKELKNLQWINLHGNQISSISGEWSHPKTTISTLFLGENDITEIPNDTSDHGFKSQHSLKQFKSLVWLNLDGNRINKIHKHSLPSTLQTVSISHNLIENFPFDIIASIPRLQWLYLRGNHIKILPQYTFVRKLWLEKIDLGENYLKTLPEFPFNNSLFVRELNLAFNDIEVLNNDIFSGLNTGKVILSYNLLHTIETNAFSGVEKSLEYLDVDHNNLQIIPETIGQLTSLKYLYLSSNSIKDIPSGVFDNFCSILKGLSLSGNYLKELPANALSNCTKLSYFNIAFNNIDEITVADFTGWENNLENLILSNNRISELRSGTFSQLKELRELSLSFNPIRGFDKDTFEGLDNLESLEMSFMFDQTDIPYHIFQPLSRLKWLTLDYNNIDVLSETAFDNLSDLVYLNMESNKLRNIPKLLLKSSVHSQLKDIRFSVNDILFVETGTFENLESLETILLSGNKIKYIQTRSFINLRGLTKLFLSNNILNHIGQHSFVNLTSLKRLDMQNNRLTDFWFGYFANVTGPLFLNLSRNQISSCKSDKNFLNINVLDLNFNNLNHIPKCLKYTFALRKLFLDFNKIVSLESNDFTHLTSLEELSLQKNGITHLSSTAFVGLQNLQILNLSKNQISHLHSDQFLNLPNLRTINLSENSLNYLPRNIFSNTVIEMLDLSSNSFVVVPSQGLADVSITLRYLSMHTNNIEHIDIQTFPDIPQLHYLDLNNNRLSLLPDNVFSSLGALQILDLSSNPLRTNFKELFHYAQNLRYLSLTNSRITTTPHFPLPNLLSLNLSYNSIEELNKNSFRDLQKLKILDLSHNNLIQIPSHLWINVPNLKHLDLSHNPIRQLLTESFVGLQKLQILNIQHLKRLNRFESKSILQLKILSELEIQTWPNLEHFAEQFCHLLSHIHQLRILKIYVWENDLSSQLHCCKNRKIRRLEITGRNLKNITKDAFVRFSRNSELYLKIHGTQLEDLPSGLFSNMNRISYLTIDLRQNQLTYLNPEAFYENSSSWKNLGTTLISGGLLISDNPLRCNCHLTWLGHWLRHWKRESQHSHSIAAEDVVRIQDFVEEATCIDENTGIRKPIVRLSQEGMNCHASALSGANPRNNNVIFRIMMSDCSINVNFDNMLILLIKLGKHFHAKLICTYKQPY